MPIPDAANAVAEESKVRDYLLNHDHPDGGAKAVWFYSLGYSRANWTELAVDLLAIAKECEEFDKETTTFGVKYRVVGVIGRAGHRPGKVLTVWISEDRAPPRLVTAFPEHNS